VVYSLNRKNAIKFLVKFSRYLTMLRADKPDWSQKTQGSCAFAMCRTLCSTIGTGKLHTSKTALHMHAYMLVCCQPYTVRS